MQRQKSKVILWVPAGLIRPFDPQGQGVHREADVLIYDILQTSFSSITQKERGGLFGPRRLPPHLGPNESNHDVKKAREGLSV